MFPYSTIVPIHWQHDFTCFCTLRHYVTVNLNFHENHVQYVQNRANDPTRVTQYTIQEFSYPKHKNWKKIFENQWRGVGLEWCLSNVREPSVCLSLACRQDVTRHFQCEKSTISRLLNRFQQTRNVVVPPRSGRPSKTMPREDRFLMPSSRRNRFLSSRKLDRLLGNATGTRVCDRTVRNRPHAARMKACHPYIGIPLTLRHGKTRCLWARVHQGWTSRQWCNVLVQSRFTMSFADGLQDHRISLPFSTCGTT